MVTKEIVVKCPFCGSENITRQGWQNEKQTYRCENSECPKKYFTESYTNKGCDLDVRRQIWQVDYNYVQRHLGDTLEIDIVSHDQIDVREAEMDEMWSFVYDKSVNTHLSIPPIILIRRLLCRSEPPLPPRNKSR